MKARQLEPEIMDDPSLDAREHARALEGLARINAWSRSGSILWQAIRDYSKKTGKRSLRVLDIATGAGDLPVYLWEKSRKVGLHLEINGCDKSHEAVAQAKDRAGRYAASVRFFTLDILSEEIPAGYDIVMSSLFFHHLKSDDAENLLKRMAHAASGLVLVNDLLRGPRGLFLAYAGTRLLSGSHVVHVDGPLSVKAAFTLEEIQVMARQAGLLSARVERRWPERFLLSWEK